MESLKNSLINIKNKLLIILGIISIIITLSCVSSNLLATLIWLLISILCFYFALVPSLRWFKKLSESQKTKIIQLDTNLKTLNLKAYKNMGGFLNIKNIRYPKIYQLLENLSQNEDALYFSFGKIELKKVYIYITNKKIILNTDSSKSIQYEKINTVENSKNCLKVITNSENIQISQIPSGDEKQLAKYVRDTMELHKSIDVNITQTFEKDVADKIAKLKVLYDEGILSEYEFNMKKIELLDKSK